MEELERLQAENAELRRRLAGPADETIEAHDRMVADCCERMASYLRTPLKYRTAERAKDVGVMTILREIITGWSLT